MKRAIPFFIILTILFSGCGSSKKQLSKGNYDAAIDKAVKELRRDRNDEKQIQILSESYKVANELDMERIRYLRMEGRANSWDEIFQIYQVLSSRQTLVRTVTPLNLNGRQVDFPYVDYMPEMVEAKRKAADFYFAHGNQLMEGNIKENYRQAYAEFLRAKNYMGDYPGIDNKIQEAKFRGISRVFVSVQNSSIIRFPPEFEQDLLALNLPALNSEWVEYHTQNLNNNTDYDYFINVNVRNVAVTQIGRASCRERV